MFPKRKEKNMQNYAQIGDIDHYSLHIIFIISVCLFVCVFDHNSRTPRPISLKI